MTGQADPDANVLGGSPYAADPRMDPRAPVPQGQHSSLGDTAHLSDETWLDAYLQEMQAAKKREQMMKMAAMGGDMGQAPQAPQAVGWHQSAPASPAWPEAAAPTRVTVATPRRHESVAGDKRKAPPRGRGSRL